jgi:hypothetical protein
VSNMWQGKLSLSLPVVGAGARRSRSCLLSLLGEICSHYKSGAGVGGVCSIYSLFRDVDHPRTNVRGHTEPISYMYQSDP